MRDPFSVRLDSSGVQIPTPEEVAVLNGQAANFVRCASCGFLDREDFMLQRFDKLGYGCRNCDGSTLREPKMITKEEERRIKDGFYKRIEI